MSVVEVLVRQEDQILEIKGSVGMMCKVVVVGRLWELVFLWQPPFPGKRVVECRSRCAGQGTAGSAVGRWR